MPKSGARNVRADLKATLQAERDSRKLETLAAAIVAKLLDVPVLVAKSGFQFGGDAGTAGRQGRRLRVETKKYADTTSLSDRELLGELDQAAANDRALEAWILVASREVSEQLAAQLLDHGEVLGVPVLIFDWPDTGAASFAALCAAYPELVEIHFGAQAAALARRLAAEEPPQVEPISRDVASWGLGYEALRSRSHAAVEAIWASAQVSQAELGQDVAGGERRARVQRVGAEEALDQWWRDGAADAPVAATGWDGVGKTWAVMGWIVGRLTQLPVVLVASSASVADLRTASEAGVKRFLAERLQELSPLRDRDFWLRRLDRLLERPLGEGPWLTLVMDGLNQEPGIDWLRVFKVLQGAAFAGRVRVIATTRNHHFEERLSRLRGLVVPAVRVPVEPYSLDEGGELSQMLAFEGLKLSDLHPDLLPLARTPRLFHLVVRFRDRLVEAGQVTVHRLLWEYGRDSLGERAGRSFSEGEWREWLQEVAGRARAGIATVSTRGLEEMAARPGLDGRDVFARLSDIVDGQFAERLPSGSYRLNPTVVDHALAAALLEELSAVSGSGRDAVDVALTAWLDPIAGLDQRAEILRAAVSIVVETEQGRAEGLPGVLVAAWLQTQNIAEEHRLELSALAPELCGALLDSLELSRGGAARSATVWAVNALCEIPRSDGAARDLIVRRIARWFSVVSRDLSERRRHADIARHRTERLEERIGQDRAGPFMVLGHTLTVVDDEAADLRELAPSLLEGFALAPAVPVFVMAALTLAIGGREPSWDALKWLCLLNPHDPEETAAALRAAAGQMGEVVPEPGVAPGLPGRAAALILWLTGFERDDEAANAVDSGIDNWLTYEADYLEKPGRSFFRLERRHAEAVLSDAGLPLRTRMDRTVRFWADPDFAAPAAFAIALGTDAGEVDAGELSSHSSMGELDFMVETLELPLARVDPAALAELGRRRLGSLAHANRDARYWKAVHALHDFIIADGEAVQAARTLRLSGREPTPSYETAASSFLRMVEIWDLPAYDQLAALIEADLDFILLDFVEVLRRPSGHDIERLINTFGSGSPKMQRDLLTLLSIDPTHLGDGGWTWVEAWLDRATTDDARGQAFQTLDRYDPARFGRVLLERGWSWGAQEHIWANHHGSNALIEASVSTPFDQVVSRLAPWRILEAARRRGAEPSEVQLAVDVFGGVLTMDRTEAPDLGSDVTVDLARSQGALPTLSLSVRETEVEGMDALRRAFDIEARTAERKRATDTALARIREARRTGADLYLMNMNPADFEPAIRLAERQVLGWIEGCEDLTPTFRRRVSRSEGVYLALCEAWLAVAPERGAALWRALGETMTTRYLGTAQVDERLHILFRAPMADAVDALRREQLDLWVSNTDRKLFDAALAAGLAGEGAWLAERIEEDLASQLPWRQKRGITLSGYVTPSETDSAAPWQEGEGQSSFDEARRQADRRRNRALWSRGWWRAYLEATTPEAAFAAWTVFRDTADARAWAWMTNAFDGSDGSAGLQAKKAAHAQFNRASLKRVFKKRAKDGDDKLFGCTIAQGVGPWRRAS